jgi:spore germination protein (amino acid permease)
MIQENNKITQGQLMLFLVQSQIGIGILSLPHTVHNLAKGGAWISILIAGLISQLVILLLFALCRLFPADNIYTFLPKIIGKPIGSLLSFGYIAYFLFSTGVILAKFTNIIGKWVLPETPTWAINILMILVTMYLVKEKVRIIARFFVTTSVVIIIMVILSLIGYTSINFSYLFPVTEAGWINILKASKEALFPMTGCEIMLVIYPMVQGLSSGKLKAVSIGNLITTLFYTFEVFTSLIIFSPEELPLIPEPILYMLKAFSFHIVDRVDLLFLSLWVVMVFTSMCSYLYLGVTGLGHIFHKGEHTRSLFYVAVILFFISISPKNPSIIVFYDALITASFATMIVVLPIILLSVAFFMKKREKTI